ncbi:MAG TPA: glycosyltransferase family 39 protein [Caproiciproducens sp.]|nr:glycosyltransferase family 39 protein [Caproiciproducens sp.]
MTQNFHNFFFVSFDPSGMVSVDKPPLGLWMQAISVLIFGYHGWAMLLPQALAGTASCVMVYILTAKYFGRSAGLISSLILAITPVCVVVARNNTMDMQLVFVLLVAAWFLLRSIESGKLRDLLLCAVFIGLGFNIKMLQAYMILPAVVITYLLFAKLKWSRRFINGIISVVLLAVVSFAWVAVVELYPSNSRPYVDSTSNNSMLELITGHNGTERLFGSGSGGGMGGTGRQDDGKGGNAAAPYGNNGGNTEIPEGTPPQAPNGEAPQQSNGETPPQMTQDGKNSQDGRDGQNGRADFSGNDGQRGAGGGSEIGNASATRLWSMNLYGQSSWLLLFAACSMIGCFNFKLMRKKDAGQTAILFWSLWLAAMAVFFSFAGFYHRYYLCMIAPAIAVLSGIGIVTMYRGFKNRHENRRQLIRPVFLLAAFLCNIALEAYCVFSYSELKAWLFPSIIAVAAIGVLMLLFYFVHRKRTALILATTALVLSSLAAPFYWALTPVWYVSNTTMPYAGPELAGNSGGKQDDGGKAMSDGSSTRTSGLEQYLVKNYKQGSFLVVSQRSNDVAQYIIDTGLPCYAYGGFLGSDDSLTLEKLKKLISEGKITYFLVSSQMGGGSKNELLSYVKENAKLIDPNEYGSGSSTGGMGGSSLYLFG